MRPYAITLCLLMLNCIVHGFNDSTINHSALSIDSHSADSVNKSKVVAAAADTPAPASMLPTPEPPPMQDAARSSLVNRVQIEGNVNFESVELNDPENENISLLLEEPESPSGLGFMIPGGVITTLSGLALTLLLFDRAIYPQFPLDSYRSPIIFSSGILACGATSFTIGIFRLKAHLRPYKRYQMPVKRHPPIPVHRNTAPVIIKTKPE
jgi:hypothetical protein